MRGGGLKKSCPEGNSIMKNKVVYCVHRVDLPGHGPVTITFKENNFKTFYIISPRNLNGNPAVVLGVQFSLPKQEIYDFTFVK